MATFFPVVIKGFNRYVIHPSGSILDKHTGNIRSVHEMRIEKKTGLLALSLVANNGKYKGRYLHRLLAIAYVPNPNNYSTVGFKDGDRLNVSIDNLYWKEDKWESIYTTYSEYKPKGDVSKPALAEEHKEATLHDDEVKTPGVFARFGKALKYLLTGKAI